MLYNWQSLMYKQHGPFHMMKST